MEFTKKRQPIIAFVLSILAPGLGQLYDGQTGRGITIYFIGLLLVSIFFAGLYSKFVNLIIFLLFGISYFLFAIFDALYLSIKIKAIGLKAFNRWYVYFLIVSAHFSLIGFSIYMGLFPVKLYRIPSISMAPTLLPGDYFIIDKKHYRVRKPARGDIVVFKSPVGPSRDYIKRVVGLPGESVEIVNRRVSIDKRFLKEPYVKHSVIGMSSNMNFGPVTVPENSLFLLGDYREGSNDSRNFGSVHISGVMGKALFIVWARDKNRIGNNIH